LSIKCLVIDDEFLARELLQGYIEKLPYIELVSTCERATDALAIMENQPIDLILLDVNMPELDGLNFLRGLQHKPEIILTTASPEHALEAYQLNVIEYLLKPIYFERFFQAIEKVKKQIDLKDKVRAQTANTMAEGAYFIKTQSQKISRIDISNIIYIESMHEYIRIHAKDQSYILHYSLKGILDELPAEQFIQIHRSYIANFSHIQSIEGNMLKIGDFELSIGKNYREALMEKIRSRSIGML
jgi:two-component system, LytTR family, response regulator